MENPKMRTVIENYINAYNKFDIEGMISVLDQEVIFKNFTNGEMDLSLTGKEAFKEQAETAAKFFKERKQTVTEMIFEGETVEVAIQYRAVLAIDLPNGLKAGQSLEMKGNSTFIFNDDHVVELIDRS